MINIQVSQQFNEMSLREYLKNISSIKIKNL